MNYDEVKDRIFYKYMSLENLDRFLDYLDHSYLYGATYSQLNDPFEGKFGWDDLDEADRPAFRKKLKNLRICAMFMEDEGNDLFPNNFLMWSHYANSHKGCCFKFKLTKRNNREKWKVCKVKYENELPMVSDITDNTICNVISTKTTDWRGEHEVRAIRILDDAVKNPSPFYTIDLKAVYFGLNVESKKYKTYKKIIDKLRPGVKSYRLKAHMHESLYPTLVAEEIS